MPSRLPWPSSYLSSLTLFISRRADLKSSPGLRTGPRGPGGWCCGALVSLLLLDVAIAHPTGFHDIQIGRSWSEDSRPLHRIRHRSSSAQSRSRVLLLPSCVPTLAEANRP